MQNLANSKYIFLLHNVCNNNNDDSRREQRRDRCRRRARVRARRCRRTAADVLQPTAHGDVANVRRHTLGRRLVAKRLCLTPSAADVATSARRLERAANEKKTTRLSTTSLSPSHFPHLLALRSSERILKLVCRRAAAAGCGPRRKAFDSAFHNEQRHRTLASALRRRRRRLARQLVRRGVVLGRVNDGGHAPTAAWNVSEKRV